MSQFHITFPKSLASISSVDSRLTVIDRSKLGSTPHEERADDQAIGALNAIARRLHEMQDSLNTQTHDLSEQVSQAATEIARAVLNDQELVQNRALQFVQIAMEQIQSDVKKTAFVHPTCVETIQAWVDQSDMDQLNVVGDAMVAPGDCRVDCGDTGVTATLDAFLESIHAQSQQPH
ncbi:FliH/SctL family protein [Stieleria marina]|uniref:Flagellar assembly protein H n=1 Tax=Stieleria marina TaxID=1930275 RepID=A0A517NVN6_9BACT|nr:flagellar assembly protein H [Planctomycetes bacterium K23_9]